MTTERPIRTFHPRRGRMSARHADAMAGLWPSYGLTVVDGDRSPLDLDRLFGRVAPRVLEIGFGMGDATAAMAAADPDRDYLAVEVHTPGIGNLLALAGELGLTNVRVAHGDAMELVRRLAPEGPGFSAPSGGPGAGSSTAPEGPGFSAPSGGPGAGSSTESLDAIHVFFPDPWPKARHHKRRLIQPGNVRLLRRALRLGGVLHCATDWPDYAEQMAATLAADPGLAAIPAEPGRPETKFERRGVRAGRPIVDLMFRRTV